MGRNDDAGKTRKKYSTSRFVDSEGKEEGNFIATLLLNWAISVLRKKRMRNGQNFNNRKLFMAQHAFI
jgi:hypothetical protein